MTDKEYAPGQIIIIFKGNVTEEQAVRLIEAKGWKIVEHFPLFHLMLAAVPEGKEMESVREIREESSAE